GLLFVHLSFAQDDARDKLQQIYNNSSNPEISFEKFFELNSHIYAAGQNKKVKSTTGNASALAKLNDCGTIHTICANGDFESGAIDMTQWKGAFGTWTTPVDPNP